MDLNEMSLQDLKRLQRDVEQAIASVETRKLSAARAELEARARELGFSLAWLTDMTGPATKPSRAGDQPKYRNPTKPEETWSGRGRRPRWLAKALNNPGATLEDFQICSQNDRH